MRIHFDSLAKQENYEELVKLLQNLQKTSFDFNVIDVEVYNLLLDNLYYLPVIYMLIASWMQ